ncbi:protein LIKE EARLY STARVATION, chloroplastic [Malania oleifera]|uniref:protein LIKE EARLY STARVATION, chloroplastic n=1 Tax=Malania oleifera TaxID=397392 RepID=UPI0025ADD309|nr:protein LIKE EARLY STARVATION, chloroplastic [Malania oleifera]
MASHLGTIALLPISQRSCQSFLPAKELLEPARSTGRRSGTRRRSLKIRVSYSGESYLSMWKKAVERERKEMEFQRISESSRSVGDEGKEKEGKEEGEEEEEESAEDMERKSNEFRKILEVSREERDRIQRMQVIDRAAAAIAAARAVLSEGNSLPKGDSGDSGSPGNEDSKSESREEDGTQQGGRQGESFSVPNFGTSGSGTPGPDFWSWTPPPGDERKSETVGKTSSDPVMNGSVIEKERSVDFLSLPLESVLSDPKPPLPPLQSLMDVEKVEVSNSHLEAPSVEEEHKLGVLFSAHAIEAADALDNVDEASSNGVNPDGSRWWKETGIERRPDGVICKWTLMRGVSADKAIEWEEKFWEAADQFDYKELGSEKSGRDAAGNVWREYWRESMRQEGEFMHLEKTADKWGKNGKGDEWQEKWWEHYDSSGQAEKWAHKSCSIDPNTQVEDGHAHVWHERWGEKYNGHGGSTKYTDKWAERFEGDGWTKWGDKWDENFDSNGHGVKQGETWWQGKKGEQWNRTWGEGHNGSGWVHKYGKSSSGEHWDTHVEQDTWYQRFPHYGFFHCFENSVQLREVQRPLETS